MSTLMIKSKVKLGCNICDKCCINRGDIKLTPINVIQISKYMNITIKEFLEKYTLQLENEKPEIVLKAVGKRNTCILNNQNTNMCKIHKVKPMQCVTFPLIPIDLEHDIFYNQGTCVCDDKKEMKVLDWLNGRNGIYKKYKKIYIEWIALMEQIQINKDLLSESFFEEAYQLLFCNYKGNIFNEQRAVRKNIKMVKSKIKKY